MGEVMLTLLELRTICCWQSEHDGVVHRAELERDQRGLVSEMFFQKFQVETSQNCLFFLRGEHVFLFGFFFVQLQ